MLIEERRSSALESIDFTALASATLHPNSRSVLGNEPQFNVDRDKEALFNEIYDAEHVPNLLKVPGVHAATRIKGEPFALSIGGGTKTIIHEGARYSTVYEIDGPHVLVSPEWAKAGEAGRWPSQVRPYTRNRRHALYKVL